MTDSADAAIDSPSESGESGRSRPPVLPRLRHWLADLVATTPQAAAASALLVIGALALWSWRSADQLLPGAFWRSWLLLVPDALLAGAAGLVGGTIIVLLGRIPGWRMPWDLLCALIFSAVLLFTMGAGASLIGWIVICVVTLATTTTWGWFAGAALDRGHARRHSALGWTSFGAISLVALLTIGYLLWPGPSAPSTGKVDAAVPASTMDDPTTLGSYRVISTAYGSGTSRANSAYGPTVPIKTSPVDGSAIIGGWDAGSTRSKVWGFTAAALPLNALVWMPEGPGPFPLVLILHGNTAFDDSEAGFEYLGTLLASRGYLVASIDEGFLNTGLLDKSDPISGAATVRSWLLLQHLHQWKVWNDTANSPFADKVSLSDISLIGHSRGGEGVTLAAAQRQQLSALAGPATDPDVRIRTVVALAPSDGQFGDGPPLQLNGTNYLTTAGTYDADVGTFAGARQYARTNVSPNLTKAAVSIGRADHTQFNSRWGRHDVGFGAAKDLLNTAALLGAQEQQQATKAYVSAFLDLTIKGQSQRRDLFDGAATGIPWLPQTSYALQYAAGSATSVQDFATKGDFAQAPIGHVTVADSPNGPVALPTRTGPSTNRVLPLTWSPGATMAKYSMSAITSGALSEQAVLTADLANAGSSTIGMQVIITDAAGHSKTVPFGKHPGLPPIPTGSVLKPLLPAGSISEPLLQTFRLPLASASNIKPGAISSLTITFDAPGGSVYLDNVGLTS
ncbi:MAG: hypothetical protein ACR2P2_12750 [Nakamurella sp.]